MRIIQNYIVPVLRAFERDDGVHADPMVYGTAFFVNDAGVFITAAHVIRECHEAARKAGEGGVALFAWRSDTPATVYVRHIVVTDFAEPPYDIAIGVARERPTMSLFAFNPKLHAVAPADVLAIGYPINAGAVFEGNYRADVRHLKGHIVRCLPRGHFLMQPHPETFEVSFPIPRGMSGSPLFMAENNTWTGIGVCIGNQPAELVDFQMEELQQDGQTFREKKVRIEEFGIAHSLRELADWRPECLEGKSLADTIRATDA